jgi:translation initiation factor 3 subunit A
MSTHYMNPENALKKAKDLCRVGQEEAAIENLQNILTSRRYRTWSKTHEQIMLKFIELAVNLRKNARDGLVKYRNICQEANMDSLEHIINAYRKSAEERAEKARLEAAKLNLEADDEDFEETPASIMLQAVSGESAKDRKDQQILTPWIKYLWETYRCILEILRNNNKLQHVYQTTSRAAFQFCKKFKRPVEFRRLCEMLRKHMVAIASYQHQTNSVDLSAPETQKMYLETRFQQLESAANLELWQEAYRTIEDIHESMQNAQTPQSPALMKTYYHQLAQIFWASRNYVFHAYTLSKYYSLRCNEGIAGEEKTQLASCVLLATLAVSPSITDEDRLMVNENEENLRLAAMLGFKKETPTRGRLIEWLISSGILSQVSKEALDIFNLIEKYFGPLTLTTKLVPYFENLATRPEVEGKYLLPLKKLTVLRILQQLSTVYQSVKIEKFRKICPDICFRQVERTIVDSCRKGYVSIHIDHRSGVLYFQDEDMESKRMRAQLNLLAVRLQQVVCMKQIDPVDVEQKKRERESVFEHVARGVEQEHEEVFKRKQEIEKRKVAEELHTKEMARQEAQRVESAKQQRQVEEKERLARDAKVREEARIKREADETERKDKQKLADDLKKQIEDETIVNPKSKKVSKVSKMLENAGDMKKAEIVALKNELQQQQRADAERKLKERNKKTDYFVRAQRFIELTTLTDRSG